MTTADTSSLSRAMREVDLANHAGAGAERLRIGILTPLSEPGWPVAGEIIIRGACIATEYVREHGGLPGGRQFELLVENDQQTAQHESMRRSAVAGMAKLGVVEQVLAVLGQWHLRTTPWVVELAERLGIPQFVENAHTTVTAQKFRTVFRTFFTVAELVPLMAEFMTRHGAHRVAVIAPDTVWGKMVAQTFAETARTAAFGLDVFRVDFEQETARDVYGELKAILEWGPDFILNVGVMAGLPTAYMVINQAAEIGLLPRIPMMVSFAFPNASADFWRAVGANGHRIVWPSLLFHPSWPDLTAIGRWFIDRYRSKYGTFPPLPSLAAFTDVTIIAQALSRARGDGRDALLEALESHTFATWRGSVRFERRDDHWHHDPSRLVLRQYQEVGQSFDDAAIVYPPELATRGGVTPAS